MKFQRDPCPRDRFAAKRVSLAKVRKLLNNRGIKVEFLEQKWRHVTGEVSKEGERYFFKMASAPGTARATRNEVRWNKQATKQLSRINDTCFRIARTYATGHLDNSFYFLSEYCSGQPLISPGKSISSQYLKEISTSIAQSLLTLSKLKDITTVWDSAYKRVLYPNKKFFRRSLWYQDILNNETLNPVLHIAEGILQYYTPAVNHGDFHPLHMFRDTKKQFILVDSEMACSYLPRYYDLAFFYQRVFTALKQPKLARRVFALYRSGLSPRQQRDLDRRFPSVLAERVLGSYWDVSQSKNTSDLTFNHQLRDALLQANL